MRDNSKEEIRNRMMKNAAALWGVPANEIDMSFDPIVALLISACAAEIEKIASEVDESQTRITEKIIQLMTPEFVFGARPAHAVLYTEPIDGVLKIKPEYLFSFKKKVSYKNIAENFKDIYFSPLQEFNLLNGTLKYIATGNSIFEVDRTKQLQPVFSNGNLPESTLYLGVETHELSESLKDISVFFEQQDTKNDTMFYHHLKNAEWFINGEKINTLAGFYNSEKQNELKLDSIFNKVSNKTFNIEEQVRNNYSKHYVTIADDIRIEDFKRSSYRELSTLISDNKIKIEEGVAWIKIVFPRVVNTSMLETVFTSLNAVPVINRKLNSFTYQLKEFIDIIPITTEDLFLDLKTLTNTSGKSYKLQSKDDSSKQKGTFIVRADNVGKLDHRKAKEYVTHLIELLKDESASFSFFNNDFLFKNLKNLNQLIALLENKVSEIAHQITETTYISLTPFKKKENLIIEYWTTNGVEANAIKSGSVLKVYNGVGIKQKSSVLLTSSFGGKSNLTMNERLNAYRRSLLSRDRIVSREDVKALCYEMYDDKIKAVSVSKGYTKDIDLKKGLLQCITIEITPNPNVQTKRSEWEALNKNVLLYLEKHSVSVFPYIINIID
ncbi:type VI secretion system baseplate subunit TssF [Bizionia paragorgiae]|uniref:type VI secretion system baseplate subunit TssF n=1 Tax=Bizionia paragorgiae TaxID=283786 RepID=UPI00299DD3D1|nr:type VI secretion system baseplate subunit TssF [Bizionia paragorgiae]MDX1270533.1 type VI secretion system baseplate subunit TssF [Bizionia paragorgiae]